MVVYGRSPFMVGQCVTRLTDFAILACTGQMNAIAQPEWAQSLPTDSLIEFVVWDGLDSITQGSLVEIPLPFRRGTGRRNRRWPLSLADVDKNALNRRFFGDCGNYSHLGPAMGTDQRQCLVDSSPQVFAPAKPAYITSL